VWLERLRELRM